MTVRIPERLFSIRELSLILSVSDTGSELKHPKSENVSLNAPVYIHLLDVLGWAIDLIRTLKHTIVLLTLIAVAEVALLQWIRLEIRLVLVCAPVGHPHQLKGTDGFREVDGGFLECLSRFHESHPEVDLFQIYHLILQFVLRKL